MKDAYRNAGNHQAVAQADPVSRVDDNNPAVNALIDKALAAVGENIAANDSHPAGEQIVQAAAIWPYGS